MIIAEEFIDNVTNFACTLAKHHGSNTLETKDLQLYLGLSLITYTISINWRLVFTEKNWNIRVPGFSNDEVKQQKKPNVNEAHKQRLQSVRKSKK